MWAAPMSASSAWYKLLSRKIDRAGIDYVVVAVVVAGTVYLNSYDMSLQTVVCNA